MSPSRNRYSREFKLEVIRRVQETDHSQAQVAQELDLAPNTFSPTNEGWVYLARVMNLGTRKIVGWSTMDMLAKELTL